MPSADTSSCAGKLCPCGSGQHYSACCGRYHGGVPALTPEALMRSRYSAFALDLHDYLLATWHASTRPTALELDESTRWVRLEVLDQRQDGDKGRVHFRATFQEGRRWAVLEENSRFVQEAGRWFYVDGKPVIERIKPGRNDACPCGSGRKFKSCCGLG
ncbi:YchJ family protein [Billgrantia sp. C5P2]|uniref:YchJ family protein n=1 Tax=Billgrantia sp. C5P2 TaxID=3436239 RepID=UPI003DA52B28